MAQGHLFDARLQLKDAGLVAASANGTVAAVAKILDVGNARCCAMAILNVTAIETGTGDEKFTVLIQGSTDSGFASGIRNLAMMEFGHVSTLSGPPSAAPAIGKYELPFINDYDGVYYRYIRLRILVAGTIATGINLSAFVGIDNR
jgi:hypothetical protein